MKWSLTIDYWLRPGGPKRRSSTGRIAACERVVEGGAFFDLVDKVERGKE